MSKSIHVVGFISADNDTYRKHAAVLKACLEAGIKKLPEETALFFDSDFPEKYLLEDILEVSVPSTKYEEDMVDGYEVIVADIPENVDMIRFYISY